MNSIHRKLPVSVLMGISLIGLLGLNPAVAESLVQSPVYVHTTDTEGLQAALNEKGWDAQFDASGSLIVRYQHEQIATSPKPHPSAFEQFAKALADRGWSATGDDDGNLILRPNQPMVETFEQSHVAQGGSQEATADSQTQQQWSPKSIQFSQRLESVGWHTDFTHNGDLIVHFPGRQPAKHAPEINQTFHVPGQTGMDWLANRLRSSGWMTHRDETGSLILSRPSLVTPLASTDQTTASEEKAAVPTFNNKAPAGIIPTSNSNHFSDLRKAAENRGWRLSYDTDGGLLLVPFG